MNVTITPENLWNDIEQIRKNSPLIHNITNYVVMNTTANALLAIGASPVMAHAEEEVADMVRLSSALVINIGTLNHDWIEAMTLAMQTAKDRIPIVLDPVGAGATAYRTRICREFLAENKVTIIRGNASEIMAMSDASVTTKGVDSSSREIPLLTAKELARTFQTVVVVSGETDLVTDGQQCATIRNGHAMMPRVTGLGCTATALIGAFAAIQPNTLIAAAHAMATMGICGELAAEKAAGPGSLQMHFLDSLYLLDAGMIAAKLEN